MTNEKMTAEEIENWLAIRKEAGLQIDPETAEVDWDYALALDPYYVGYEIPEEYQQVGREYFARSPGSDRVRNVAAPQVEEGRNIDDRIVEWLNRNPASSAAGRCASHKLTGRLQCPLVTGR